MDERFEKIKPIVSDKVIPNLYQIIFEYFWNQDVSSERSKELTIEYINEWKKEERNYSERKYSNIDKEKIEFVKWLTTEIPVGKRKEVLEVLEYVCKIFRGV